MDVNCTLSEAVLTETALGLVPAFTDILASCAGDFEAAERECLAAGHRVLARALGLALERRDGELCSSLPEGARIHDRRSRALSTTVGDVAFTYTRCRDERGGTVVPLADDLDRAWGARISPAARAFLLEAGAEVSYKRSADLLERAGGSAVSAQSVMRIVHRAGQLCADEDAAAAESFCDYGVLPDADCVAPEICVESDGTYFKLQGFEEADSVEVRAMVAYAGKVEDGGRTLRARAVRHGCVGPVRSFWEESTAAVGTRFDLSKVERVHMGSDGEACYLGGFLRIGADRDANIDPFHVNRKVMSCFGPDAREISNNILGMVIDGYAAEAADCVEMAGAMGLANRCWPEVADYLRNNAECIYRPGAASLGTMEAEQQHVYGARMDSVPCGWSVRGADAMARVRSRRASQRELPRLTREMSVTPRRKKRAERLAAEAERRSARAIPTASRVPLSVGRGRGAEHTASLVGAPANVRYAAGVDSGMVAIGW